MEKFKSIYCRAKSILNKEDDAKALMKEVYALAENSNVSDDKAEAWMIKQTYIHGCGKFRKKKAREAEIIELQEHEYMAQEGIDAEKTKEVICDTLAELPDLYHATLFALYYDNYSIKEVAAVTGYSVGVVLNRLNYIHKYLNKKLEIYQEDNDVKVQFSVEMVYEALKQWADTNALDDALATESAEHNIEAVKAELEAYSVRRGLDKKKLAMVGAFIGALILLALVAILIIGNGGKEEEQDDKQPVVEQQEDETEEVPEEEVPKEEIPEEEMPNEEIPEEDVSDSDYILPDSNTRKLTEAELQGLTKAQLRLARNEIFARYGVIFGVADLDAYFGEKSWYEPKISLDEFKENNDMNSNEDANLSLIVDMEDKAEE